MIDINDHPSILYRISCHWLENLEKLIKEKNSEFLNEFKSSMKRYTLIGFFCSNYFSHCVMRYSEPQIYFFAVVDNFENHLSKTIRESYKFFKTHGLSISPVDRIGYNINIIDDFIKIINSCYDEVVENSLINQEEGAVKQLLLLTCS
jgi:hypothetical protein